MSSECAGVFGAAEIPPERPGSDGPRLRATPIARNVPMKVGLLTGGGDCPGLNAVIRAVVQQDRTTPAARASASWKAGAGWSAT